MAHSHNHTTPPAPSRTTALMQELRKLQFGGIEKLKEIEAATKAAEWEARKTQINAAADFEKDAQKAVAAARGERDTKKKNAQVACDIAIKAAKRELLLAQRAADAEFDAKRDEHNFAAKKLCEPYDATYESEAKQIKDDNTVQVQALAKDLEAAMTPLKNELQALEDARKADETARIAKHEAEKKAAQDKFRSDVPPGP